MKKIAALIAMTVVASAANASFITNADITLTSEAERSTFAPGTQVAGTASNVPGALSLQIDTQGSVFNGGTITGSYSTYNNPPGGFGTHANTYTNITYTIGTTTGTIVDFDYNGTGTWLVEFAFGNTADIASWTKKTQAPAVSNINSNAGAVNSTGSMSCVGAGCSTWGAASVGLEGLILRINVNQNAGFAFLGGSIVMNEFVGSSGLAQAQVSGTLSAPAAVPVPAAAWLMGSGLVGLAGIARRRKMA